MQGSTLLVGARGGRRGKIERAPPGRLVAVAVERDPIDAEARGAAAYIEVVHPRLEPERADAPVEPRKTGAVVERVAHAADRLASVGVRYEAYEMHPCIVVPVLVHVMVPRVDGIPSGLIDQNADDEPLVLRSLRYTERIVITASEFDASGPIRALPFEVAGAGEAGRLDLVHPVRMMVDVFRFHDDVADRE